MLETCKGGVVHARTTFDSRWRESMELPFPQSASDVARVAQIQCACTLLSSYTHKACAEVFLPLRPGLPADPLSLARIHPPTSYKGIVL